MLKPKYQLVYRYNGAKRYQWSNFESIKALKWGYEYIIKKTAYFKIFVYNDKTEKYETLITKYKLHKLVRREVMLKFVRNGQKHLIMGKFSEVDNRIKESFKRV